MVDNIRFCKRWWRNLCKIIITYFFKRKLIMASHWTDTTNPIQDVLQRHIAAQIANVPSACYLEDYITSRKFIDKKTKDVQRKQACWIKSCVRLLVLEDPLWHCRTLVLLILIDDMGRQSMGRIQKITPFLPASVDFRLISSMWGSGSCSQPLLYLFFLLQFSLSFSISAICLVSAVLDFLLQHCCKPATRKISEH